MHLESRADEASQPASYTQDEYSGEGTEVMRALLQVFQHLNDGVDKSPSAPDVMSNNFPLGRLRIADPSIVPYKIGL